MPTPTKQQQIKAAIAKVADALQQLYGLLDLDSVSEFDPADDTGGDAPPPTGPGQGPGGN
jgi:hypothetical protein